MGDIDATMNPEDVCVLESLERGVNRLRMLGIDETLTLDKTLRAAVEELETLESRRSHVDQPMSRCARWILEELQLTPWHLTHEYMAAVNSSRSLFAVTGLAEPSGHRGEGVSFLRIVVNNIVESLEIAEVQKLNDLQLKKALVKAKVDSLKIKSARSRWNRLVLLRQHRQFPALHAKSTEDLKQSWDELLQDTFQRQVTALGDPNPVMTDDEDIFAIAAADRAPLDLPSVADNASPALARAPASAPVALDAAEDDLLADLEADLELNDVCDGTGVVGVPQHLKHSRADDEDVAEIRRLRGVVEPSDARQNPKAKQRSKSALVGGGAAQPVERKKVPMLKVVTVEKGPLGKHVERVLYVFGEDHIRRYREQQQGAASEFLVDKTGGSSNVTCDGEASSIVSSGNESLRSSALGPRRGRKRPGSDATGSQVSRTKRLKLVTTK